MPVDKLTVDEIILGKMSRVIAMNKTLTGKDFGEQCEGGRNRMAKVVVFKVNFSKFGELLRQIEGREWSDEQKAGVMRWLDCLIDILNTPDSYWEMFWEGKLDFKPNDYVITKTVGDEKITETIFNISKITILE